MATNFHAKLRPYHLPVSYDPDVRHNGYEYYTVERILHVLYDRCEDSTVRALCDRALSTSPTGLDLRNNYLLRIRVGLQDWHSGVRISIMCKILLQRILDDTVTDPKKQKLNAESLTLKTLIAFDLRKFMTQPFGVE